MRKLAALSVTLSVLMTACTAPPATPKASTNATTNTSPAAENVYVDPARGFSLAVPRDMKLRHDFQRSYLDGSPWKAFAKPDSHGSAAAALVLDGSNKITAAELRVGVSSEADAVARCTQVPDSGVVTQTDTVALDGTPFVHFHAGDAAMSHYLQVEGYRAVHDGRCYALDLWINGTRPEVYNPPATAPFANADALRRLHQALAGFRFVH